MQARDRAEDVLRLYRLARSGGSRGLLRWISGRAEGWAGLVDGAGTVLHGVARTPDRTGAEAAAPAAEGARELASRGARSLSFDTGPHTALLFALDGPPGTSPPALAVVAPRPLPDGLAALLSDATMPLALCWAAETVERKRRRVDLAESRGREAVLHLLMTGQLSLAHQVAGALKPTLPDPVQVCVVECPGGRRDDVARICADLSGGRSWIVRCPVYARHLILVVPTEPEAAGQQLGPRVAGTIDECVVGMSEEVPLSDTATGYRQAFHALAVARGLRTRHARFGAAPEAALAVGAAGAQWADALLNPLLTHLPRRSHDPGGQELAATLSSWLAFSSHATQHLKIHRNTLAARLRLIGELLGLDLNRLADQAALDLALRVRATPTVPRTAAPNGPESAPPPRLDTVLRGPAVQEWAARQLRPLTPSDTSRTAADPRTTLRTWLACEAQLGPTAAALGLSVPGARKRLTRLESTLERSLLQAPSARYDLWLAFRALDLAEAGAVR
ncbi:MULTISPECIES: helix-turn-helix domain-containing protein [unclassified Streptomyces]|uniref:helix-turn-helix domain-containing protein n=1 Tax=unclassified Streptomyces TaxID=2593676 RepID=UPI0036EBBD93